MKTLKEMADHYANSRSDNPSVEDIKAMEVAYLAGAKAALEMAESCPRRMADSLKPKDGSDEFGYFNAVKSVLHNAASQIHALIPKE